MTIRSIERLSGRNYFVPYYEHWRDEIVPKGGPIIGPALDLIDIDVLVRSGTFPPALDPNAPLIVVANHPYGILDGLGTISMIERLGRPFKVLINNDLLKAPEIRPYALPIDFAPTRAAQATNIATRNEALRLLKEGTTIIVFPAGGVATSPTTFGRAVDLPWKRFTARMIHQARAQVLPLYFEGQCSPLFQFVSKFSPTLRLALIIREFRVRVGEALHVHVGDVIPADACQEIRDRKELMAILYERVHALGGLDAPEVRARMQQLPAWLVE
jgi:putative hemolysin